MDTSGNAYVTGTTRSTNFPIMNPFQSVKHGIDDAFVTKFNTLGAMLYSTYLGGDHREFGHDIAVDASGNAYVIGDTLSRNFPTMNPFQATPGGRHK